MGTENTTTSSPYKECKNFKDVLNYITNICHLNFWDFYDFEREKEGKQTET
jgi:hypothetical protein